MSDITEKKKIILSNEEVNTDELFETNDLKLATSLIASGLGLVAVRHVLAKKGHHNKPEIFFCFRQSQDQHEVEVAYLSGSLVANAVTLLDTRDRLISYIANGHRNILNYMTEEVVRKK